MCKVTGTLLTVILHRQCPLPESATVSTLLLARREDTSLVLPTPASPVTSSRHSIRAQ